MKKKAALIGLVIMLGSLVVFLLGCPPPIVRVRPPEPRVEYYGHPPYPKAVWISGHWKHRGGEWVWIPGHWEKRPKPHAHWVPGHWEERRGGWVWIKGHWEYR